MAIQKNPNQIVRKDGRNCFVEVMNSAFEIGKVMMNFVSYNTENQAGSKITANISIYLSFDEFYRLCHDITVTRSVLKEIYATAEAAKKEGKKYAPYKVLCMGGRSAQSLAAGGSARPDGKSLSRQMKICAGEKLPIILSAESGPGEQNEKGLIVPKYQQPEQRVMVGFTYETIEELFLITKAHVDAYIVSKYTYLAFHPEEKASYGKNDNKGKSSNYAQPISPAPNQQVTPHQDYYPYVDEQVSAPSYSYQAPVEQVSSKGTYANAPYTQVSTSPQNPPAAAYGQPTNVDSSPYVDMDIFNAMMNEYR